MEVIERGISWRKLEKAWDLQGRSTRTILGVLFLALGFSRDVTHFYGIALAMTFDFSRISKTNLETSVEYLQRHFFNHLVCFILEQTPDRQIHLLFLVLRYPAHCNGLELLPESPQNKFCYRLHPKYTAFSCFPVVCTSPVWKSLFLQNRSHLTHLWYLEGSWMNAFQNFCQQFLLHSNMAYFIEQAMAPTIILYMLRKFKYWCIQKDICDIMLPLVM